MKEISLREKEIAFVVLQFHAEAHPELNQASKMQTF